MRLEQLEAVLLDYIERYGLTEMARELYHRQGSVECNLPRRNAERGFDQDTFHVRSRSTDWNVTSIGSCSGATEVSASEDGTTTLEIEGKR